MVLPLNPSISAGFSPNSLACSKTNRAKGISGTSTSSNGLRKIITSPSSLIRTAALCAERRCCPHGFARSSDLPKGESRFPGAFSKKSDPQLGVAAKPPPSSISEPFNHKSSVANEMMKPLTSFHSTANGHATLPPNFGAHPANHPGRSSSRPPRLETRHR